MSLNLDIICDAVQLVEQEQLQLQLVHDPPVETFLDSFVELFLLVMQSTATDSRRHVLGTVRKSFWQYWKLSIYCVPLGCSVNRSLVCPCHLKKFVDKTVCLSCYRW